MKISDHISHCDTCNSAFRGLSGEGDSLASRLRAALLDAAPPVESACLRMQHAAQAIRGGSGEPAAAESERDEATGESPSDADSDATATFNRPPPPSLPATIGRYHVRSVLGRGGFGTVYLAHDPDLDRLVAIKVPRFEARTTDARIQSLLQDARTAARLTHPGIVTVYEVGRQSDGSCYIVMEYVDGPTLAAEMAKGKLPRERAVQIVREAADALHYAHKKGFVHRDLKPGNILLDAAGHVKIVDFGLAVHEDQQRSHRGELAGTLAYMSPEQLRGQVHRLDGRSDIWSLGVILYELLTGRKPFAGTRLEMADEIQHRSPKPPRQIDDTIPPEVDAACLRCLSKEISGRFATAGDLSAALILSQSRRHQRLLILVSLAAALLLVLSGVGLWLARNPAGNGGGTPSAPLLVDDVTEPFRWFPLLTQPPFAPFPARSDTENWPFDAQRQELLVNSPDVTILVLGETKAKHYELQIEMVKTAPVGDCGLLFGMQPLPSNSGYPRWSAHCVWLLPRPNRCDVWHEALDITQIPGGFFGSSTTALHYTTVPLQRQPEGELTIAVADKRLREVTWRGQVLSALSNTDATDTASRGMSGQFGIINRGGTTTFRDARIKLKEAVRK